MGTSNASSSSPALVNEPELLVLDEPFSGLDPLAMGSMSEMLAEVAAAGTTVLFSSHQLDLVEDICEDVVIINAGRVVRAGDLAELRAEVPQRVVTIRLPRGAPDWSRSSAVEVVDQHEGKRLRAEQGADLAAMIAAAQRDTDLVSFADLRRSPSCSGRRWRHERRARAGSSQPARSASAAVLAPSSHRC